jgi:hypothetical protein
MPTSLQHDKTTAAKTGDCCAAELLWDDEKAEAFGQICQIAFARDCLCQEGEPCPLMARALKGVVNQRGFAAAAKARQAETLAEADEELDDGRKQQLADYAELLIADKAAKEWTDFEQNQAAIEEQRAAKV